MFDQAHVISGLLRMMIAGDHPIDLKLTRLCVAKLHREAASRGGECPCSALVEKIEVLDQAHLFSAPPRLVDQLRSEALRTLAAVQSAPVRRPNVSA